MDDSVRIIGAVLGVGIVAVLIAIFSPLLYAVVGYFTGWVLYQLFTFAGKWIVNGFAELGVETTINALPQIGAMLGFVGAFFKAHQTNNNK